MIYREEVKCALFEWNDIYRVGTSLISQDGCSMDEYCETLLVVGPKKQWCEWGVRTTSGQGSTASWRSGMEAVDAKGMDNIRRRKSSHIKSTLRCGYIEP